MHAWIRTAILLLVCLPVASPDHAQAVDVAFWTPYRVDADTYGLFPLDRKDLTDTQGSATFQSIETVGEVAFETQGKFGGAIRLDRRGAIRAVPGKLFAGGHLAVEAWVKLDRYPHQDCQVLAAGRRPARRGGRRSGSRGATVLPGLAPAGSLSAAG